MLRCESTGQAARFVKVALLGILAHVAAALAIGDEMLPGGHAFALLIVWLGASAGAQIVRLIRLPPLVGMLLSGVVSRRATIATMVRAA